MHSTLVVDGEGVPLGVPQICYEAPEATGEKRKPAEERKTRRWVEGLRECARLASELEGVRPVSVMDREGDSFELFVEQRRLGRVDLLVRAQHNRRLGRELPKLFERVRAAPAQGRMEIEVGRRSARRATRQQKASQKREARLARVGLRWRTVELALPRNSDFTQEAPVRLNLVHVREENAPEGVRPLEWFLLTSVGVRSSREAKQVLEWYRLRWRIEEWHRVLKTGCKAEYLGHQSGDRIERAVTIKAVIAWRLMAMTLLGRTTPELPAEVLFSDMEILALKDFAQDRRLPLPDHLGGTVVTLARLGGYLNRNYDPPPGHQKIWEGYVRLATMAQTYERLIKLNRTSNLYERLRPVNLLVKGRPPRPGRDTRKECARWLTRFRSPIPDSDGSPRLGSSPLRQSRRFQKPEGSLAPNCVGSAPGTRFPPRRRQGEASLVTTGTRSRPTGPPPGLNQQPESARAHMPHNK